MNRQYPTRPEQKFRAIVIGKESLSTFALQKLAESHPQIGSSVPSFTIEEAYDNLGFLTQNAENNLIVYLEFGLYGRSEPEHIYRAFRTPPQNCELVLVLNNLDFFTISKCRELGAQNIISKEDSTEVFENSLRSALGKSSFSSAVVSRRIKMATAQENWLADSSISPREKDVLIRLGVGLSPKEIGHEFSLSSKTISTYRTRLMQKLKLQNNAEICYFCIQHFPELVRSFVESDNISIPQAFGGNNGHFNYMNLPNHSVRNGSENPHVSSGGDALSSSKASAT
ncbi:MAG: hypothetical protein CMO55_23400 [Verrucomicrobiales bacterium]|nr:hypothetical protein [Verrucomicrobiales bacterium]